MILGSKRRPKLIMPMVQTVERLLIANDTDLQQYCICADLSELEELFSQPMKLCSLESTAFGSDAEKTLGQYA